MKHKLAELTEQLFMAANRPGLFFLPLSTGGGKSYTIGKLACTYYPRYFKRIVILTIQNKLSMEMKAQLEQSISSPDSLIKPTEVLLLKNNIQNLMEALKSGAAQAVVHECLLWTGKLEKKLLKVEDPESEHKQSLKKITSELESLKMFYKKAGDMFEDVVGAKKSLRESVNKDVEKLEQTIRQNLRSQIRKLFKIEQTLLQKPLPKETVFERVPSLAKAYPACEWESKRVIYMTVHKALYGLDPIVGEIIQILGIGEKGGNLFIFDESDSCGQSIRAIAAKMSIQANGGVNQSGYGYEGFLSYQRMIENGERLDRNYWPACFDENIPKTKETIDTNWRETMGDIPTYNSIYLHDKKDMRAYRRGVFFSGAISSLYIRKKDDKRVSYIGHVRDEQNLSLLHTESGLLDKAVEEGGFESAVPMHDFLHTVLANRRAIIRVLALAVKEKYKIDRQRYEEELQRMAKGEMFTPTFSFEPTLMNECYSLVCRFALNPDHAKVIRNQIFDYLINRKNIRVKLNDEWKRVPDQSVYMAGFELYQEVINEWDLNRSVQLKCRELSFTPEKIFLSLLSDRGTDMEKTEGEENNDGKEPHFYENNAVILSSATAMCPSVVANLDINYLSTKLFDRIHWPDKASIEEYDRLNDLCYPKDHQIATRCITQPKVELSKPRKRHFPKEYLAYIDSEAVEKGLPEQWFRWVAAGWDKAGIGDSQQQYEMGRLLRFVEVYHYFYTDSDIQSFLYFQNRKGERDAFHYHILASLVDGSWKKKSPFPEEGLPKGWVNDNLAVTSEWEELSGHLLNELSNDKDKKVMLVASYKSIATGTNMQYPIPAGANVLIGDAWPTKLTKKDWDGIYVQMPTHYLSRPERDQEDQDAYERQLYLTVLNIMMLYERGAISEDELKMMLRRTVLDVEGELSKHINPAVFTDACWWAQNKLSQAVGRICRTRYKPGVTHILFDEEIREVFAVPLPDGSYTKEFRALRDAAINIPLENAPESAEEVRRVNDANRAVKCNKVMLTRSLFYYNHPDRFQEEIEEDEDESDDAMRYSVLRDQSYRQTFKRIITRYPVIQDWDKLDESERAILGMARFYGDWPRDEDGAIQFFRNRFGKLVTSKSKEAISCSLSPADVRLPQLLRCPAVRDFFKEEGIALEWKTGGEILHPDFLQYDYCGEIGEQAFLAICYAINPSLRGRLLPLSGRDYEIADFVLYDSEGKRKLAFDVKNFAPEFEHLDKLKDTPTADKRAQKLERLGCRLITVNTMKLPDRSMDPDEIPGILLEDGSYYSEYFHKLQKLISDDK